MEVLSTWLKKASHENKMVRLRRNFLLKLGLFVVTLLLLGPYLFHLKLGEESQESYQQFMNRKRREEVSVTVTALFNGKSN